MIKEPKEVFTNCSTNAVQILFNEIPKGVPEIGLDKLDPLYVPVISVSFSFDYKLQNIQKSCHI